MINAFVTIAALLTDEVVAVIVVLRTNVMLAMLSAVFTQSAVLAKFTLVEAIAAVGADMVVEVRTIRAEFVFAVIVCLAVLAQAAVLALLILGTLLTLGTEMVFIVGGSNAVAMPATFRLTVLVAASFA